VTFDDARRAFGVEADVIERSAGLARRGVLPAQAMFEEVARNFWVLAPSGPVTWGPPMRAVGSARFTASAV
jgi:hypothetical protein